MTTKKRKTLQDSWSYDELSDEGKEIVREKWREKKSRQWDSTDADMLTEDLVEHAQYHHRLMVHGDCYWSLSYCQGDGVAFYGKVDVDVFCHEEPGGPEGGGSLAAERKAIVEYIEHCRDFNMNVLIKLTGTGNHYHHWNSMGVEVDIEQEWNAFDLAWHLFHEADYHFMSDDEKLAAKACCGQLDWHAVHVWLDFAGDRGLPVHDVAKHFALGQHTEHWDWMQKQIHDCFRDYMKYVSRDCERFGYAELEYRDSQEAIEEEIGEDDYEFDADGNLLDN